VHPRIPLVFVVLSAYRSADGLVVLDLPADLLALPAEDVLLDLARLVRRIKLERLRGFLLRVLGLLIVLKE